MEFIKENIKGCLDIDYIMAKFKPLTPYGKSNKKQMEPFKIKDKALLLKEYDLIASMISCIKNNGDLLRYIRLRLSDIKEIRGSLKKAMQNQVLDEIDLYEIKSFLFSIKEINKAQEDLFDLPNEFRITRNYYLESLLDPYNESINSFYIYDCYSEKLQNIRYEKNKIQTELREKINEIEEVMYRYKINRGNIRLYSLFRDEVDRIGEISIVNSKRDVIEAIEKIEIFHKVKSTNYYTVFRLQEDSELYKMQNEVNKLRILEEREEANILKGITEEIVNNMDGIYSEIEKLGRFDFVLAKAELAIEINGVRPIISDKLEIKILEGRYTRLEEILEKQFKRFTPVSFEAESGVTIITGANMGGKTISLKTTGMICYLAQMGFYVPAMKFIFPLFDFIFFSTGDNQSISTGLSTFASEIKDISELLKDKDSFGLILIDELARGTNPYEGCAIAKGVIKYLSEVKSITLFTTHFDCYVKGYVKQHLRVRGLRGLNQYINRRGVIECFNLSDCLDYTLEKVEMDSRVPRDAIKVARMLGLNDEVLNYAEEFLDEMGE